MRGFSVIGGLMLAGVWAGGASAIDAMSKVEVKAAPDKAWAAIGDFCGLKNWHPVIASCEMGKQGNDTTRTLTTKDGVKIFEKQVKWDDAGHSYTYAIIDSPLPVANYQSTIKVEPAGGGSTIIWTGKFDAKGTPDADAQKLIAGIYAAGLDALKAKLN